MGDRCWLKTSECRHIGGGGDLKLLKKRHKIFELLLLVNAAVSLFFDLISSILSAVF